MVVCINHQQSCYSRRRGASPGTTCWIGIHFFYILTYLSIYLLSKKFQGRLLLTWQILMVSNTNTSQSYFNLGMSVRTKDFYSITISNTDDFSGEGE